VKFYIAAPSTDKSATRRPGRLAVFRKNVATFKDLARSWMGAFHGTASACNTTHPDDSRPNSSRRKSMNLTRVVFLALAVLLPTSWTIAHAEDAPAADAPAKKEKKGKKAKKGDDKKADDKKAE
jgi:hypothetical protein